MDRISVERYRLALFGRLVMGVAHEVDNHLSVVLGFAELIRMAGMDEQKTPENAGKIYAAGDRITSIMKQYSHHVRPHPPEEETFTLRPLLLELVQFARYDLCRGNVTLAIPENLPDVRIRGDARDFGLVLLALLLNGAEAMATGGGGDLTVASAAGPEGLIVEITDVGPGIPAEILPRVFEEGFSTKRPELHSGMGLPVSRHIVERFEGTIQVGNRPGGGCVSAVRVPAS